jgi:hypothetical protein
MVCFLSNRLSNPCLTAGMVSLTSTFITGFGAWCTFCLQRQRNAFLRDNNRGVGPSNYAVSMNKVEVAEFESYVMRSFIICTLHLTLLGQLN